MVRVRFEFEETVQCLDEIRDDHRGRKRTAIPNIMSGQRNDELISRREQGFQKEIAIVVSGRAIARTRILCHQVESGGGTTSRKRAVTHSENCDDAKGDRPQWNQLTESHPTRQEGLRRGRRFDRVADTLSNRLVGDRLLETAVFRRLRHVNEDASDRRVLMRVRIALRERTLENRLKPGTPVRHTTRLADRANRAGQNRFDIPDGTQELGITHRAEGRRRQSRENVITSPNGVCECESVEPPAPGMRPLARQAERFSMEFVESEANSRSLCPLRDLLDPALVEPEACSHRLSCQPIEYFASPRTPAKQVEQAPKSLCDG